MWICLRLRIDTGVYPAYTPACLQIAVTKHLLDGMDIGPAFEHQRRHGGTDM